MQLLSELLELFEENKLKAYKLTLNRAADEVPEADLWNWVEEQDVVTIEDIKKKGNVLYVYPHFEDKYNEANLKKLQRSLDGFVGDL